MFTIVGSGFGIYGYLPALAQTQCSPILLPRKYEAKVRARPELARYLASIRWTVDTNAALEEATGVVVATTPAQQYELLHKIQCYPHLQTLILEKPVATNPDAAREILKTIRRSGRRFRIGFTFLHTQWASVLNFRRDSESDDEIKITWKFMAHHFRHDLENWKRNLVEGGGVLRFYGIHLLAMLARHGYETVDQSCLTGAYPSQPERWVARMSGPGLMPCNLEVDCRSDANCFQIARASCRTIATCIDLRDPFELEKSINVIGADLRVGVLVRLLQSFREPDTQYLIFVNRVNQLWLDAESEFVLQVAN